MFTFFFYKKRLEEEIARMKKNQERRLHRKNAKIVKEGGTPMQLNRPVKPDTTVNTICFFSFLFPDKLTGYAYLFFIYIKKTETMRSLWSDGSHE